MSQDFSGHVLGLSIGESKERHDINGVVSALVNAFVGHGLTLSFGHDWRKEGVMETLCADMRSFKPQAGKYYFRPIVLNVLPWPEKVNAEMQKSPAFLLVTEEASGAPFLDPQEVPHSVAESEYVRSRALTGQREDLDDASVGRLCVGGKRKGYVGRYPGIVEEALMAVRSGKPLYLSGMMGGSAGQVILALEGKNTSGDLVPEQKPGLCESSQDVWDVFHNYGIGGLSGNNGLSVEENRRLFRAGTADEIVELVLKGFKKTINDLK